MATTDPASDSRAETLGNYLKSLRTGLGMTLRDVEKATANEISNAYLSQLETGKITKPSPHSLHTLSLAYRASYEGLMERAGYIAPSTAKRAAGSKHGRAATFAIEHLTPNEEKALLEYLAFIRSKRAKG